MRRHVVRLRRCVCVRRARLVHAVHRAAPGFWRNVSDHLVAGRPWVDRAVVIACAAATGLLVVGFTLLAEGASHLFSALRSAGPYAALATLIWTPALTVAILWWTRRFVPGAAGSGIPQVIRALDDDLQPAQRAWLVSVRVSLHKAGLVSAGLLAGLSIGREGPTVQVGAGIMHHARRWLSPRSGLDGHDLMVAGAAAGIAAAFNTPLGGVIFALEQLSRRRGMSHSALVIASIVVAGLVAVSVFGNATYFGRLRVQEVSAELVLPGLIVAVVAGLSGGLFARLMVLSARGLPEIVGRWRREYPLRFGAVCGLLVALIGLVTNGATAGAGYAPTRAMLEGQAEATGMFTVLKFVATALSAASGVPAGVFAPSLTIGAGIGHDVAQWFELVGAAAIPLIALGMVGFLAASTQGPLTAFIIVMEMVAGHAMVLSLMACALLAAALSRLLSAPMYTELAELLPVPPRTLPPGAPRLLAPAPPAPAASDDPARRGGPGA
jgi:H+/Cl- antiporter ClcA